MKKGVQLFTVRDYMKDRKQVEESLKKIKALGYDSVQNGTPHFMTDSEIKSMLDDIGLAPCSAYGDFMAMLANPGAIKKAVAAAKTYGVKYVGVGTLPNEWRESADGYKNFAAGMNKIGKELSKEGCGILYHNHALEFFSLGGGKHGMDILFGETDPSCVFFSHDTHWLTSGGVNPVDWIYKSKGRMPIIHFKDYAIVGGAQVVEGVCKTFAEVGEGNLDWANIVKACHDTGIEYAIVEQDVCRGCPFDSLETSYKNMVKFGV
ncbi:MAG: sugar phosphate isomerase/epimerase [Oscillospiraceae bacterium]|nr:sugar phosphate isomerase/epimerase [Oscillospiraceae bacterium]